MRIGRSSAYRIAMTERRTRALALRRGGMSYRMIADRLRGKDGVPDNYAHTTAYKDVMAMLTEETEHQRELADQIRELELQRLDAMLMGLWNDAQRGNHGAVDRVLRISERRAKLLGLDAPVRTDITSDGEPMNVRVILRANDDNRTADAAPGTVPGAE